MAYIKNLKKVVWIENMSVLQNLKLSNICISLLKHKNHVPSYISKIGI